MRWKPDGRRTQGADVLQPVLPLDTTLRLVMNQSAEFSDEEAGTNMFVDDEFVCNPD